MNKHKDKEVASLLCMTKLSSNLKLKDNQILIKIVKGLKDATEYWICNDNDVDNGCTITPNNTCDVKRHCLKNTHSMLKTHLHQNVLIIATLSICLEKNKLNVPY